MDDNFFGNNPTPDEGEAKEAEQNNEPAVNENRTEYHEVELSFPETVEAPTQQQAADNQPNTPSTGFVNGQSGVNQPNFAQQQNPSYQQPPQYYQSNGYQMPPNNQMPYGNQQPTNMYNQPAKNKKPGMKIFIGIVVAIVVLAVAIIGFLFGSGEDVVDSSKTDLDVATSQEFKGDNVDDIVVSDSSNNMGDAVKVAQIAKKFNVAILVYVNDSLYTEGSGVLVQEDKDSKYTYIITCAHVINVKNAAISVMVEDGTEYKATIVGVDTRTDIGVLRIEATGLPKAELADSDKLIVGQTVYAVGNPGGSEFFGSVTNGIISAIDRPISSNTGYEMECIQHTSAINPGNSGGALVNGEGKVIGINSMKIASTEYEGMGFAVPSNVVMEVFNSIKANGYVAGRAKLGITYLAPSDYSQNYSMYVQMKGLPKGSIVVYDVAADSDMANKGVKRGDLITKVNGKDMTDTGMLSAMIEKMTAGDTLTLTIVRIDSTNWTQTETDITVKLVEDKGNTQTEVTDDNSRTPSIPDDLYDFFKEYYGY